MHAKIQAIMAGRKRRLEICAVGLKFLIRQLGKEDNCEGSL
jgi:hypothetical protein